MYKINLDFFIKGVDEKPLKEHAGQLIANWLCGSTKGDALKYYDWGRTLYKKNPILVDRSDLDKLKKFIDDHDQLTVLTKAQILEVLNSCEEQDAKHE